jgi:hypothetical protein
MKLIKIIHEGADSIEIQDEDGQDLSSYVMKLSKLLEVSNVSILETTSGSVIIRPSRVCSIVVSELSDKGEITEQEEVVTKVESEQIEQTEDVITDGE